MQPLELTIWERLTYTAWWQLFIVITTALLTQLFGQMFLENRKKRQKIVETASTTISSAREIRSELSAYKQHEINFNENQEFLQKALSNQDSRIFDYHKQTVVITHDDMSIAQRAYETARIKFVEAVYLLRNMCYERLGEDREFKKAADGVIGIDISLSTFADVDELKKAIDMHLLPHLRTIEEKCGREIYLQTRSMQQKIRDILMAKVDFDISYKTKNSKND